MEILTEKQDFENEWAGIVRTKKYLPRTSNLFGESIDKLGELEALIKEIDNATIIYKDGIASFHIDMILTSDTIEIVKKHFNYKEVKIR